MQKQKIIAGIICLVMLVTQSFSNWVIFSGGEVEAAGPVEENKLVAMFVEQNIYDAIKTNLQRYTLQYIQGRFERTKVLVFPVDTSKIQATDIQKIITNLYHGGEKDTPSTLIGTILVGKIPLPVIKKDTYIFPSVLPYTDIEKPLYVFDQESNYFTPTTSTPDNRQELVHGLISFNTTNEYNAYFDKLKAYARDPKLFAEQKFWFEDFNKQEKTFTDQNVPLYLKGQIFDEDLTYHRYSPSLFSLLQESNNKDALNVLQTAGAGTQGVANPNDEFASTTKPYTDSLAAWGNSLSSQATQGQQSLQQIGNGDDIPTLVMGQSITQQVKPYESIFSAEYGDFISKEIESSARWTGVNIGSHITKASFVDQQTSRTLLTINSLLESTLDKKIEDDKWALNIPIPVVREKYKCVLNIPVIPTKMDIKQENFYFGKNAWDITGANQTTWFRGTFGNYTGSEQSLGIGRGGALLDSSNSSLRTVGSAFGITNQQVVASRGYNTMKALEDAEAYKYRRQHCGTTNNGNYSLDTYSSMFRGGNTPLNVDGNTMKLKYDTWESAYNPTFDRTIGGPLFDIGGARMTITGSIQGTNANAANYYGRMIQVGPGPNTGLLGLGGQSPNFPWCNPKVITPAAAYDYFSTMMNPGSKDIQVVGTGAITYDDSKTCKERIVYKPINSIVKHTSPTKEEIDAMNITTKDRPIDVKRYISFQSYGGQNISLQYPNLYNVEVYKNEGNASVLKSVDEIKQAIIDYLQTKVTEYNTTLSGQNALIAGYIAPRAAGLAKLAAVDPYSTPVGRQYSTLPNDFFVSILGADTISQIAQNMYIKNSGWPIRLPSTNVGDAIKGLENQFSLSSKIYATVENNIVVGQKGIGVNQTGYEAGYIRANGSNVIAVGASTTPSIIANADNKRQVSKAATNQLTTNSDKLQATIDDACGVSSDGTVPLLKWPKALTCRWKNLRKVSLKDAVKISYKNAQGPVLPLKQFSDVVTSTYEDYVNKVLDGDLGTDSTITSLSVVLPGQKVIRGAQLPFNVSAKNSKGEEITNLLFPVEIAVDTGYLMTIGQAIPRFETTSPSETTILDTSMIDPSVSRVRVSVHGPLEPGIDTGTLLHDEKEIILVNGTLQTLVNNSPSNTLTVTLPDNGYTTVTAGIPSINENLLPSISLRLTDGNNQPLTSPATITSSKGIIKPGIITTTSEQTSIGQVTRAQFTTQDLWTIQGGALTVKLLPSMVAGTDTLTISVPGLPDRLINVTVGASSPYGVSVIDDVQSSTVGVRFAVQDRWGNTITTPQNVQYSILGDATSNGAIQGNINVTGSTILPITYGPKGGIIYIYGVLAGSTDSQPGYVRKDIPTRLRPTTGLNIVYLTLEGKDRGNPNNNIASSIISTSPKTLSVTTELFSQASTLPTIGIIGKDGNVNQGDNLAISTGSRKNITINNIAIGYLEGNGPYTLSNIIIQNANYKVVASWNGGSTSNEAFAIIEANGEAPETKEQDLSPIRSYAGGTTVGEAQKQVFDETRVNYGDPFLQHIDATKIVDTSKDTTITLFKDDTKTIKKTMELDIDSDGRKDLVILYDDDTIRFMKQYGGTPPYRQLGSLMAVADGVQDMWIGDADNNGLQDIFIKTKKNTLRVYKNSAGIFDVNGSPICIDVPSGNTSLQDVRQLFIEDMNKDKLADIITYDVSGKIRIFYGGSKSGDGYYISTSPAGCDAGRKQRNSSLTVATYGLQLIQNTPIYDDSIIRWQGLMLPDFTEGDEENNDTIPSSIASSIPDPANPTSINVQGLINSGIPEVIRFTATPYDHLPVYENQNSGEFLAYIPLKYLTGTDTVDASKSFAYGQGDEVIVTITLRAKQNTIATYAEQLRGPWELIKNDDGSISGFNNMNLPSSSIINWNIDNGFEFMIDNIPMSAGQSISFSYPTRYRPAQSTTIGISDTNNDGWLDITTTPVDSCMPTSLTYVSNQGATYTSTSQTINTSYTSGLNQLQGDLNTQLQNINTTSQNVANGSGNLSQVPGINQALETWDKIDLTNLTVNGNFNLNVLNSPALEKGIDDAVKGLCQGFGGGAGGGKKGPPVPFNMAFLAPGDFNVFGCKVGSDKGLPAFFFPGTIYVMGAPVPFPYGLKGPGDGFYWAGGGNYPSMIRIYVAPTLTASLGTAICFGPYSAGINLPNPIKHIAGNCIVIAPKGGKGGSRANQTAGHPNSISTNGVNTNSDNTDRVCSNPTQSVTRPTSPFSISAYDGSKDLPTRPTPVNNTQGLGITQGTYLGLVNFDTQPYATQLGQQSAGNVQLKGGKAIKLQIQGGNVKGLIKCIINKWLDNQIRYMINNLTNMSINVYLPDVSQLMQGFKNVRLDEINKVSDTFKENPEGGKTPAGDILKNLVTKAGGEKSATSQSEVSEVGSIINNPFNALSSWFEQVPLIKVNTKNVTVQVPYIYNEDLTRYFGQVEAYNKQIEKSIREWDYFVKDLKGKCDKEQTPNRKDACNKQLSNYIDITTKTQQLQRSIKQNISTLQAYKRFPLELQQWLTISQRYITEVTDTVQGISTDITAWLNTNATRFDKYVDAIILMVGAVKSWQALINFSVDWKSKCGQCKVDNYDYYSCTLSLLCPKLPILAIPPFRLPNIYVDLSHIRLGLDVVLPNIHFVPKTITLPELPELPSPPTINVDFTIGAGVSGSPKIPTIPQIPSPPRLPELPSFIPSIDINLPTLPPAPKVPRLSPAITSTLKVVSAVGKILCIVKSGIGLVGEKGVKTRIEQMTQRTRDVKPFDSISITSIQPPLRGFDLRVDSYLNFELNFDVLYTMLDKLTKGINKKTNSLLDTARNGMNTISQGANNASQGAQGIINNGNINTQGTLGLENINEPELVEPSVLRNDLQKEIAALKNSEFGPEYTTEVTAIENLLTTKTNVKPNIESVKKATKSLEGLLQRTSNTLEDHKSSIGDYDSFLKKVNSSFLIGDKDTIKGDITASLFTANDNIVNTIKNAEHPTLSYINLQEKIVKGFSEALNTHTPEGLNMGIFAYNKLQKYFATTEEKIQSIKGYISSEQKAKSNIGTKTLDTVQTIIAPPVQAATLTTTTVSPSNTLDIWRDEHSVYTNQTTYIQKENDGTRYTRYYDFEPISKYSDFASRVDEKGFITRYNTAFSVWNWFTPITSLEVVGQSSTTTNIRRKNGSQKAYAIMLTDTIYANHELNYSRDVERKYAIAYDSGFDIQNSYITLPSIGRKRVSDLMQTTIISTIAFDPSEEDLDVMLSLTGNKRSYTSITPLVVSNGGTIGEMTIGAAWSAQETLGVQRRGDNTPPVASANVRDRRTGLIVGAGTNINVPRNSEYDVIIKWTDDGTVINNEIINKNRTTTSYNGDSATLEKVDTSTTLRILGSAKDQSNNEGTQTITITFSDPTIKIDTVAQKLDQREIGTSLSTVYPNGFVRFFNQRSSDPYLLTGNEQGQTRSDFPTNPTTSLTGRVFFDTDTISLFNSNQQRIARIEKKTGKIIVMQDRQNSIKISLDFTQNTPSVLILDTKSQTTLFSLYLKSSRLLSVDGKNGFTTKQLSDVVGTFAGGTCIQDQNQVCVVYITTDGNIYSPDTQKGRVGGSYMYDGGLHYGITIDGKEAGSVSFIPIPLE